MAGILVYLQLGDTVVPAELPASATAADLADEAARLLPVPRGGMQLSFQGQQLQLDKELSDAGVGPESRVEVSSAAGWDAIYQEPAGEDDGCIMFRHAEHGTVVEFMNASNGWWRMRTPQDAGNVLEGWTVWDSGDAVCRALEQFDGRGSLRELLAAPGKHPVGDVLRGCPRETFLHDNWMGVPSPWGYTWMNKLDTARVCFTHRGRVERMSVDETKALCSRVFELHPGFVDFSIAAQPSSGED
eukprot:TRINITY_DN37409_c0_g1_i3.p1 TRINITY_DN37409_c0_g1~~TRINITY_DN37409_c0_g1_i3.p1  ORF type:complete len:244 (+),score=65.51 TRINITY_DN37409_c0_g1_i3:81-812(+)